MTNDLDRVTRIHGDEVAMEPPELAHQWYPIKGLDAESVNVDFREIDSLHQSWLALRGRREKSDPDVYQAFLERIYRRWSIETGIIEGIYSIDINTTLTLVEKGLSVDLVDPGSTDKAPHDVIKVLNDHRSAAEFVTESIRQERQFSKFYMKELHQILLRNQKFYFAEDQFGTTRQIELNRGVFKLQPNSPNREDGKLHQYCPPEQVESELDNLIIHLERYQSTEPQYHPLAVAAWLHHRFTQVHPFEDGNGRVARAILTWHLARERYLPVVISREDKSDYIATLEQADRGDLGPFIRFIIGLERQIILEALGADATETAPRVFTQVLEHVAGLAGQRVESEQVKLRSVNDVACALRDSAKIYIDERADEVQERLIESGLAIQCVTDWDGPDNEKGHWYYSQIVKTAKELGNWVNFNENRYFVKLSINPNYGAGVPRLVFVISLHHVGRQVTGIMAASAFAQIGGDAESGISRNDEESEADLKTCSPQTFTFTAGADADAISDSFNEWIQESLSVALAYWGQYLS